MKTLTTVLFAILMTLAAFAAPTVTDVVAKQRYPWNGLVDITCKVSGIEKDAKGLELVASAIVPDLGVTNKITNFWIIKDGVKSSDRVVGANGNYKLLWDAKADLGEVRYTNMVASVIVKNTMVQLWKDGPYWATTNIGAEKPEDYGYYFWWGDTVGYKRENDKWVASDGSMSNFSFERGENTPTFNKGNSSLQSEGWITADGVLALEHDAAHVHWGGDWRMPMKQEFDDLNNKCDWTWTTQNGVNGYVVRGRGEYESNSIFLPCAGYGDGTSLLAVDADADYGTYWSSVPDPDGGLVWRLGFNSYHHDTYEYGRGSRYLGQPVRPLRWFTK